MLTERKTFQLNRHSAMVCEKRLQKRCRRKQEGEEAVSEKTGPLLGPLPVPVLEPRENRAPPSWGGNKMCTAENRGWVERRKSKAARENERLSPLCHAAGKKMSIRSANFCRGCKDNTLLPHYTLPPTDEACQVRTAEIRYPLHVKSFFPQTSAEIRPR